MTVGSGRALGSRYQLIERLGEGAMGEVWRAHDRSAGVDRAAKLLRSTFTADRGIVGRFVQERSILMGLDHPNVVRVHDLVVEGDDLAIVMDLVEGGDLRSHLRAAGTLAPRVAVELTCAVLDALAAAHAQGCLHRDVKPDNVLLARSESPTGADVRLSDFSIARLAQESTIESTGLLGTPGYMPPELFTEGTFSAASDLYAAGILLYELLAGRTPYAGAGTAHTIGFRHVQMAPPPLPVPAGLWDVLATMLAKDPRARLGVVATATALRALPDDVLDTAPLPVQPAPDTWRTAGHATVQPGAPTDPAPASASSLRSTPPDVDVGATNLNAGDFGAPTAPAVAQVGDAAALTPAATSLGGKTYVGAPGESLAVPDAGPSAPAAPGGPRGTVTSADRAPGRPSGRPPLAVLVGVGLVALVLAVVAVLVVVGRGEDASPEPGSVAASDPAPSGAPGAGGEPVDSSGSGEVRAFTQGQDYASGLEVSRSASWDPATGEVALTTTFGAHGLPLLGPFLQVFPVASGDAACQAIRFPGGEATFVPSGTQQVVTSGACAFAVDVDLRRADSSADVESRLPLDLAALGDAGADPEQTLTRWLEDIGEQTHDVLEAIGNGDQFAAQRIASIYLVQPGTVRTGERLRLDVRARWTSPTSDDPSIFDNVAGPQDTPVLAQLGGRRQLRVEQCGSFRHNSPQGFTYIGDRPDQHCYVQVSLGRTALETRRLEVAIASAGS